MSHVPSRRAPARVVTDATGHMTYRFSVTAHPASSGQESRDVAATSTDRVAGTNEFGTARTRGLSAAERRQAAELRRISRGSGCGAAPLHGVPTGTRWTDLKAAFARLSRPAD